LDGVFEASIDNVFNYAFRKLVYKASGADYKWIFLDLTHGINYLLIAVHYATIATAVLLDMECRHRIIMVNSEPVAKGSARCIANQSDAGAAAINELSILEATRLQQAMSFIMDVNDTKTLLGIYGRRCT